MTNPIILALDVATEEAALELTWAVESLLWGVKIGSELFTRAGPGLVRRIREAGVNVFLDLKFHDIPNTVSKSVAAAAALDVQMLTIHTSGGLEMMQAAEAAAQAASSRPLVLGVTVLTSLDQAGIADIGCAGNVEGQVERLARLAVRAGLRGLVCSPLEAARLRQIIPKETQLITPGIRMADAPADDQKRTLSPNEALAAGSSFLVVGRPIYGAPDPRAAAERIVRSLV